VHTVLLVSYSGSLGGGERALLQFAGTLPGTRWLACPEGPLADAARAADIRVAVVRERRLELRASARDRVLAPVRLTGFRHELHGLVRGLDPDLIVACGMRAALALALPRPPAPPLVFLHNDLLPGAVVGRVVRAAAARCRLVVVPSEAVADDLGPLPGSAGGPAAVVIHPGVDVDRLAADDPPAAPPEVLTLGALVAWKRPELALETIALVRRELPEVRLRVAGSILGEDAAGLLGALHARAAREDLAGAVEFLGAVDDPARELARASCLLHCAEREAFGLAVAEALAAGRAAVVPAAGGVTEVVDASCAISYPPGDAVAAAAAIVALVRDPQRAAAMGARGRTRARERFDVARARREFAAAVAPLLHPAAPEPAAELALVTVTHNSAPELQALLASVHRHLPGVRIVVVDNASSDDTLAVAARWGERLALSTIPLPDNIGFGAACNRGVAEVEATVTVLVNPDVELVDDSLLGLAAEAAREGAPERLLAPLVLCDDGSRQDTAHPLPLTAPDAVRALVPPGLVPGRAGVALAPWRSLSPRHVGWAVGCLIVARTDTLRALGPFDESIFLYGEDLDLGIRAGEAGVETWFWPEARVLHHGAHATGPAFGGEPFEALARARHDVIARRFGARRALLDDVAQAVTFASRLVLKSILGRDAARERSQLRAVAAARRPPG
jgi:GT2 family glycosyltransferase/glycosyltransferase involved in cell wall biosynthesis